jgi:hypothetical protein
MAMRSSASRRTGNAKDPGDQGVDDAAGQPGNEPEQDRDGHGQPGRAQADSDGLPSPVDDPGIEVAPGVVGAERMAERRAHQGVLEVDRVGTAAGEQSRRDHRQDDQEDDEK